MANDDPNAITATVSFLLPNEKKVIKAGDTGHLCIQILNKSSTEVTVDTLRGKGVEQLKDNKRTRGRQGVLPVYLDHLSIIFKHNGSERAYERTVVFPASFKLGPGDSVNLIVTVKLPDLAGDYNIRVIGKSNENVGKFAVKNKYAYRFASQLKFSMVRSLIVE